MAYDRTKHHRRSIRLPGYDYSSPGAYFVTICIRGGECLLGEVVNGVMEVNGFGRIACDCWQAIPEHHPHVELDVYVVMPNHVHGIITITDLGGAQHATPAQDIAAARVVGAQRAAPLQDMAAAQAVGAQHAAPQQGVPANVKPGSLGGGCAFLQGSRDQTGQPTTGLARHALLATQLLGTRYSPRGIP